MAKDYRCEECRYVFQNDFHDVFDKQYRFLGASGLVEAYPILKWSPMLFHSCLCYSCFQGGVQEVLVSATRMERRDFARAINRVRALHRVDMMHWFLDLYSRQCLRCGGDFISRPLPPSGVSRVVLAGFRDQLVAMGLGRVRFLRGICFCAECAADAECVYVSRIPFTELPLHFSREWMTERGRKAYLDRFDDSDRG